MIKKWEELTAEEKQKMINEWSKREKVAELTAINPNDGFSPREYTIWVKNRKLWEEIYGKNKIKTNNNM